MKNLKVNILVKYLMVLQKCLHLENITVLRHLCLFYMVFMFFCLKFCDIHYQRYKDPIETVYIDTEKFLKDIV